jgi:hypothetical protein
MRTALIFAAGTTVGVAIGAIATAHVALKISGDAIVEDLANKIVGAGRKVEDKIFGKPSIYLSDYTGRENVYRINRNR